MRLLLASFAPSLVEALEDLGCEVHVLDLEPGSVVDVEELVRERGLEPDLLVQREHLGGRAVLRGLDKLDCPTVFWSLDTHLNMYWQRHYARLFDGVMTTQSHLLPNIRSWGVTQAGVCTWFGTEQPCPPFADRPREIGFVGRVTPQRQVRARLAELIRSRGGKVADGLDFKAMTAFYGATRAVPNESILAEVNLRLFEAASCGCLVLCPDLGEGQNSLFEPGREMAVYRDGLELIHLLERARKDPAWAESLGRAARARVQREHLVKHRVRSLLGFGRSLSKARAEGREAQKYLKITLLELCDGTGLRVPMGKLEADLYRLTPDPEVSIALLGLYLSTGQRDKAENALAGLLADPGTPESESHAGLNLRCSMTALRLGQPNRARQFLLRQLAFEKLGGRAGFETPVNMLVAWAKIMAARGVLFSPGFTFNPGETPPSTALQCLLEAHHLEPENTEVVRRLDAMLSGVRGMEFVRLGFLSWLGLRNREDWRLGLALGETDLQAFRIREGLDEIALARTRAAEAGQEARFLRALDGRDPRGLLRAALKW